MNEPLNSESDFQPLTPESKLNQNVEDSQGVNQQAAIGDNNSQNQNVEVVTNQPTDFSNSNDQNQNFSTGVNQQSAWGNNNIQNENQNQNNNKQEVAVNFYYSDPQLINKAFLEDTQKESSDNENFVDPTKILPPNTSNKRTNFELDVLQDNLQKLQQDRLIFVSCLDQRIAWEAVHALADRVDIDISNKRLLTSVRRGLNNFNESSIDTILRPEIGGGKPTLIVVDAGEIQTFLDSLVVRLPTAEDIKNDLKNSQKLCICLVEPEILKKTLRSKQVKLFFYCWEIASLTSIDENKPLKKIEDVDVISLFEKGDALTKTILYVATFFPKLSFSEFERIVLLFLGNQTSQIELEEIAVDDKNSNSEPIISLTIGEQNITFRQPYKNQAISELQSIINIKKEKLISETWKNDPKFYGEQPFRYPVFSSLRNDNYAQNKLDIVDQMENNIKEYDINTVVVIGHTDGQALSDKISNIDNTLKQVSIDQLSTDKLNAGSNAELGLMRALAVVKKLQEIQREGKRLQGLDQKRGYRVYSAAQLMLSNGEFAPPDPKPDSQRRRIEIYFTKSN